MKISKDFQPTQQQQLIQLVSQKPTEQHGQIVQQMKLMSPEKITQMMQALQS
jgi:hypothetical protein